MDEREEKPTWCVGAVLGVGQDSACYMMAMLTYADPNSAEQFLGMPLESSKLTIVPEDQIATPKLCTCSADRVNHDRVVITQEDRAR